MTPEQLQELLNEVTLDEASPVPLAYSRKGLLSRTRRYALYALLQGASVALAVLEHNGREYDALNPVYIAASPADAADVWRVYA